jgi:hypothetical protein
MRNKTGNNHGATQSALLAAAVVAVIGFTASSTNAVAQELNIDEIFFCHEGKMTGEHTYDQCLEARDTTLITCTACHVFTPFVKAQKTDAEWDTFLEAHRQRVPETSNADYEEIGKFLKSHFNPENPVPQLPPELENYTLPPA